MTDRDHDADGDADDGTVVRRERFAGGPARGFVSSLAADERIFAADLAVDRAHVVMLAERDVIDRSDATAILAALAEVEAAGHGALPDGEDVHEAIESAVVDRVGPEGGRMHTARSRNDEVAACIRYRFREDLLSATTATLGLREALVEAAADGVDVVIPGYTHLQPAQPVTAAHYLLSYAAAVRRDTARLLAAFDRTNRSPLGAAAFAGTTFDVDRERTAALLGFDGVLDNATDAVSARDFLVEGVAALATGATAVSGLAEDLVVYANRGLVDLSDDYASTSSIMPQKKNPDTVELARAVAGDAIGDLTGLLTTLKGLPRAYNRDLQRATPHAWDAVDDVTAATEVAAGVVGSTDWDVDACRAAAAEGFSTATGVADLLARAGVPFRTAHEVVAEAATRAGADGGRGPDGRTPTLATLDAAAADLLDDSVFAYVTRESLEAALDPVESVAARDSAGGPAPEAVAASLDDARAALRADREAAADRRRRIDDAADRRRAEVADYV